MLGLLTTKASSCSVSDCDLSIMRARESLQKQMEEIKDCDQEAYNAISSCWESFLNGEITKRDMKKISLLIGGILNEINIANVDKLEDFINTSILYLFDAEFEDPAVFFIKKFQKVTVFARPVKKITGTWIGMLNLEKIKEIVPDNTFKWIYEMLHEIDFEHVPSLN